MSQENEELYDPTINLESNTCPNREQRAHGINVWYARPLSLLRRPEMESYRALILIFNNLAIRAIFADFCIDKYDVYGQCSSTNLGKKRGISQFQCTSLG